MGCVYCKVKNANIKLSESDIIPDALTNKKILFNNVCKEEHNNRFSKEFEQKVIKQFAYVRNKFLIFSSNRRGKERAKYEVEIKIDGYTYKTNITTKYDFFNSGPKIGIDDEGNKVKLVSQNNVSDIDWNNSKKLNLNNCIIDHQVRISSNHFVSSEMLRMVSKIGYEWYCKENNITEYKAKYYNIVDFITGVSQDNNGIVTIVKDMKLYEELNKVIGLGGHALGTYKADNGNVFVYFSFFNIIIYRIRIYKSPVTFMRFQKINFSGNWADGNNIDFSVYLTSGKGFTICKVNEIENVQKILMQHLEKLETGDIFSLKTHKYIVDNLQEIFNTEKSSSQYDKLIGFCEKEKLSTLYLLHVLGENNDKYDETQTFNENLYKYIGDELLFDDKKIYEELTDLYNEDNLKDSFLESCKIFNKEYEKYKSKN